jgi:REP element-mobilizing transposase RayT
MPRSHRLQVAGGIYHLTARGNRRQDIFVDDDDREFFLRLLDGLARRRGWAGLAYCLMRNHYHLVAETPDEDLSAGMQWLNGTYAQLFNARHGYSGHLFQGRFHSVLVESQWHLLELSRYLAQNPVRARFCADPKQWRWSSYRVVLGASRPRRFLRPERVLALFGTPRSSARKRFESFVNDAPSRPQP